MRTLLVALAGLCLMAAQPKAADVKEVVVVFKTHFDIGFTERAGNVVDRYRTTMIDKALDLVDQSRNLPPEHRFVWTVSGWPLEQILWEGQSSQRRERVIRAIREGRLAFHALPFTTHTESLDLEELVRGLGYSSSLARRLNLPLPRDAKMTDVPEHTWIIPTILRHAGVEFLHVGCNGWSSPPEVPDLFWWEGPDGSRVLAMNSGKSYGTGLVPPPGWPYRTWLALMMTGDNQGPPTPDVVKKLLEQAKRDLPGVRVRFGRLSDFAGAIVKENATIPVVRADMPDTWIHGIMSLPVETKLARNVRPQIGAAAALDTLLNAWGVHAPALQPGLVRAYEQSLLYGEHTWGFNSAYFGHRFGEEWRKVRATGYYDKLEETWDDHRAYARRAADSVASLLGPRMAALAQAVKAEGPRLVVFNPLPWRRDALVRGIFRNFTATAVKDVESGEVLPVARSGERFAHMEFMARDLPAMGYRTYIPVAGPKPALPAKADPGAIENEYFRITLDAARGGIRSLVDKRTGRELAAPQAPYALGQYLYERFDADRVAAFTKAYLKDPTRGLNDFGKLNLPPAAEPPLHRGRGARLRCGSGEHGRRYARAAQNASWKRPPGYHPAARQPVSRPAVCRSRVGHRRQDRRPVAGGRVAGSSVQYRQPGFPAGPARIDRRPRQRYRARRQPRPVLPEHGRVHHRDRWQGRDSLSPRFPHGEPRPARRLALFAHIRRQARDGLREPLQQPVVHELRAMERRDVDLARPPLGYRGQRGRPGYDHRFVGSASARSRRRERWTGRLAAGFAIRPGAFPTRRAGNGLRAEPRWRGDATAVMGAGRGTRRVCRPVAARDGCAAGAAAGSAWPAFRQAAARAWR